VIPKSVRPERMRENLDVPVMVSQIGTRRLD
jgi:diketogulonate reductase-like aldo/keto reductase